MMKFLNHHLNTYEDIVSLFNKVKVFGKETYSLECFSTIIEEIFFVSSYKSIQTLDDLNNLISESIDILDISILKGFSSEKLLNEFEENQKQLHSFLDTKISSIKNGTLFGFGIGEGLFEEAICKKFNITMHGYDPFVVNKNPNVIYIDSFDEFKGDCDLFLSKWVLHHVREEERWNTLKNYIGKIKENTEILFIEEGCFKDFREQSNDEKLETFLLCLCDFIFNAIVRGDWGSSDNFYIKHLIKEDIDFIEEAISFSFQKEIIEIAEFNFRQTIIRYY